MMNTSDNQSIRIRAATHADVAVITTLIRAAFADVAERFHLTAENCPKHPSNCQPDWIDAALTNGVQFAVLDVAGTPVGCVALEFPAKPGVCYLERLAVLPAYRHRGLGQRLIQHCVNEASARGLQQIEIGIIAEQADLRTWYEKLGFRVTGEREFAHLPFRVAFLKKEL